MNICIACGLAIADGEKTARGSDGDMHYRCFKVGTAHGREISDDQLPVPLRLYRLERDYDKLLKRVEELERDAGDPVKHNIRIGGSY